MLIRHPLKSLSFIFKLGFLFLIGFGAFLVLYWVLLTHFSYDDIEHYWWHERFHPSFVHCWLELVGMLIQCVHLKMHFSYQKFLPHY